MLGMAVGTYRILTVLELIIAGSLLNRVDSTGNWDTDDDPISTLEVKAVLGKTVKLPCDIEPSTRQDRVYMVLWFRDYAVTPIYRYDVRGRDFSTALYWSDANAFGLRARFSTHPKPATLTVDSVQLDDEGIYRCRVDFRNSPTQNFQVNLTVVVPPHQLLIYDASGLKVDRVTAPLRVGVEFRLICEVRGGKPTPVVTWYENGKEIDGKLDENGRNIIVSKLTIPKLKREHLNNTYKCRASNTPQISPLEKTVVLDIYLKPLSTKIVSKPSILEADKKYSLTCEVVGSQPRANVIWFDGNEEISNADIEETDNSTVVTNTLRFSPSPEDNGKIFKCRGENTALPGAFLEDAFQLNVVFPPKVVLRLGSTLNAGHIKEGDDVYFECKIRANPELHKITWQHNGITLLQNLSAGVIISSQSLVLQSIGRENAGRYTCAATNTYGETTSPNVTLRIQFSPVCNSKDVTVIGASLEESVRVRCQVIADPSDVNFIWEFNNSGENLDVATVTFDGSNGTISELLYTPISERDYGTLTCWGKNSIGKQESPCVYQVIPAVKPGPLSNCTARPASNKSSEILRVDCIPGYDGGLRQDFKLEIYEFVSGQLRANISSVTTDNPVFRIKISDLLPTNHFYFVAYAVNAKGRSDIYLLDNVLLRDTKSQTESSVSIVPLILLLIGSLAAVGIATVSVLLTMYRRRGTTSPVHIEPYMKQPIITPPDSKNNSMFDITNGDGYFVEYTLKQPTDYPLNNVQPDIVQSPQEFGKLTSNIEPQLFLPVRPDKLFSPCDIHKPSLHTNGYNNLNPFSTKSWEPISFKADRTLMKEIIIANSIPGPESCV